MTVSTYQLFYLLADNAYQDGKLLVQYRVVEFRSIVSHQTNRRLQVIEK